MVRGYSDKRSAPFKNKGEFLVMPKTITTPKGVRDFLPEEAAWRRRLEGQIHEVFTRFAYREVVTPTIERLEVFSKGNNSKLDQKMYRFVDRDGELLALRPDMTTPIARVVSGRMREASLPIRLCYFGNLFRYEETQAGRQREFYQAGVELLGSTSLEADAEVVALAYQTLSAAGVKDFRIDLGHTGYVGGLLTASELKEEEMAEVKKCLIRKNLVGLEEKLSGYLHPRADQELIKALMTLPRLRGGTEILERAEGLAKNDLSRRALQDLSELFTTLTRYGIADAVTIDLGMVKEMDYYTGMILEGYAREIGYYLCSGGRYDNLLSQYGLDLPATGFALGMDRVLLVLERQRAITPIKRSRYEVASLGGWTQKRVEWIMRQREKGHAVTMRFEQDGSEVKDGGLLFVSDDRMVLGGDQVSNPLSLPEVERLMEDARE